MDARISPSLAWVLFPSLLLASVIACNFIPLGLGAIILNALFCIAIFACTVLYTAGCFKPWRAARQAAEQQRARASSGAPVGELSATEYALVREELAPRVRLHYLDDLRAFLTVCVVLHHCAGAVNGGGSLGLSLGAYRNVVGVLTSAFLTTQQSYFMCLFFFLSGWAVPASLARKGRTAFLQDRFARLGWPFVVYFSVIGPALSLAAAGVAGAPLVYSPTPSVAWFLGWLLVFTTAYSLVEGPVCAPAARPRPSLARLALAGVALSGLQFLQMAFAPTFIMMPIAWGSLPLDVAAFWAGTAAARGGWLEAPFPACELAAARVCTLGVPAALLTLLGLVYSSGGGRSLLPWNACGEPPAAAGPMPGADAPSTLAALLCLTVGLGLFAVCAAVALLDACQRLCARAPGPARAWLARVSFAAYHLHPLVVLPLTAALAAGVQAAGAPLAWEGVNAFSCMPGGASGLWLGGGGAAIAVGALLLTYPLATGLRLVPGLKEVL